MSHTTPLSLVSVLSLLSIAAVIGGCRSSKQVTASEGFFEPLKSVSRPASPKPLMVASAQKSALSDQLADSLLKRQREQERRIGILSGQLQLLQTSRKGDSADSSKATGTQPERTPRPVMQPAPDRYESVLRLYEAGQFKAASEGFRVLLQGGVPKDVEDQYHFMIGMSHFKLRQFDLAASSLKTVANWKASKLRADAFFALGQIYKQLGASRQAKSMFEAALKQSPRAALAEAARAEMEELAAKK